MDSWDAVEILLVEDNSEDAELTIRALKKKNLANRLLWLEDGEEALDYIFCRNRYAERNIDRPPKVILLDLKLPKLSGLDVIKAIRADDRVRKIPIVIVTSSREDPDIQAAYDMMVNSYVVKPVNFDQFFEAMSSLGFYWLLVNQPPK